MPGSNRPGGLTVLAVAQLFTAAICGMMVAMTFTALSYWDAPNPPEWAAGLLVPLREGGLARAWYNVGATFCMTPVALVGAIGILRGRNLMARVGTNLFALVLLLFTGVAPLVLPEEIASEFTLSSILMSALALLVFWLVNVTFRRDLADGPPNTEEAGDRNPPGLADGDWSANDDSSAVGAPTTDDSIAGDGE
jgi:hypothetical protein